MAEMIPDQPPNPHEGGGHAEEILWRRLKEDLSGEFCVYHSLPYLTDDASQGEIDFLILHRKRGMLVLECKGKGVYKGPDTQWYRTGDGGSTPMSKSPSEQATGHIKDIVEELSEPAEEVLDGFRGEFPLLYGWALCFPKTEIDNETYSPDIEDEVLLDGTDLDRLERSICEAFNFHAKKFGGDTPTMSEDAFNRLRYGVLQQPCEFTANLSNQIELEKEQLLNLSKEQVNALEGFMINDRFRVHGGAGTGKTVLARHAAKLHARQGEDVLLTCFNEGLADHLDETTEDSGMSGSIQVDNFHGLCMDANETLEPPVPFPDEDATNDQRREFWLEELPMVFFEAIETGNIGKWDVIIVDEGQDFKASWWEALETGLKDPESGKIGIFYDEAQAIFDRDAKIPDYPAEFSLSKNFRNTKKIEKRVRRLGGAENMRPAQRCPDGERPTVANQEGPSKTQRLVGEQIDTLINHEELDPNQIVILSPHTPSNSVLGDIQQLNGYELVTDIEDWDDEHVLYTTITAFKGLESDVVILIDVDPEDPRCSVSDRYVAASRAKFRLYVFQKDHWLGDV